MKSLALRIRLTQVALTLALLTVTAIVYGQGIHTISEAEWDAKDAWVPDDAGVGVQYQVDLRYVNRGGRIVRAIPVVGRQIGNSCSGWAVAYACKSFHESFDQNWIPNSASRYFSPAFLYNIYNIRNRRSSDRGAYLEDIIKIAETDGCATWSSMPPVGGRDGWKRPPSAKAVKEARMFRVSRHVAVKSGSAIKAALSRGRVVVVHVRTGPIFSSGNFKVYSIADRDNDRRANLRDANAKKHGHHAMCVVGYDDSRQAFLLQNSWGTSWCSHGDSYDGLCWVDYRVMDRVRANEGHFLWEAYILFDQQQKIRSDSSPRPVDTHVAARGNVRYNGFHNGNHRWAWSVQLTGSEATLKRVASVKWTASDGRGLTAGSGNWQLEASGVTSSKGKFTVTGLVHFSSGASTIVRADYNLQPPTERTLTLRTSDRYLGFHPDNSKRNWEWTVRLSGSLHDLADVAQVTYHLHPSFPNPNVSVTQSARNGFALTKVGFGAFRIRATVQYQDGSTKSLKTDLRFKDKTGPKWNGIRDELRLTNRSRWAGELSRNGRNYYHWTAYVDAPLSVLREIKAVRYKLHKTFRPAVYEIKAGPEQGFPLSTSGWGRFTLRAEVIMKDGRIIPLEHMLVLKSDWDVGDSPLSLNAPTTTTSSYRPKHSTILPGLHAAVPQHTAAEKQHD